MTTDFSKAINAREAFYPIIGEKKAPLKDELVSNIVGKPVMINDPKLIALIVKWKSEKQNEDAPDDFFKDSKKVKELKELFA
jgi:hypothetical protein